jgi:hypothetical protein
MTRHAAEPDATPALFSVSGGNPSPAELAAITAVVEGLVDELESSRRAATLTGPTGWERSARPVTIGIVPARGSWRSIAR